MTDAPAAANATALMNSIYRRQRHVYDATRKYYLLGRDGLIERLAVRPGHTVLEIGCGTGRNLVLAARRYPGARFLGIDVSTDMLHTAISSIGHAGLSSRVRVAHADATAFDPAALFGAPRLDRIFISYSVSMIPQWQAVIDAALARLAPGGELHIVDFGSQSGLPAWFRNLLRRWLALFHVTPRDGLASVLASQADVRSAHLTIERPFRDYTIYARLKV
ncbi:MAG TPA: class I SAM-dependent methyltransferase [Xanthobacteraceae bacterium]|nr:class I SAM-dependent methyltransferase [Xanthobacteraceae bacterium]